MDKELQPLRRNRSCWRAMNSYFYGRNRCTVRIDYAEGSLGAPEEGAVYRGAESDGASEVIDALQPSGFQQGR